jgi:DNA-binding CsgD family transcriptional regulator/tetratricopeptide (TPR) repeat protein
VIVLTTLGWDLNREEAGLPTFGRDRELAALRKAIADTAAGAGGCTVVNGSAGIGKSHVLRAAVAGAAQRGVSVAARAAFELDRAAPLITLASTLQQLRPPSPVFGWLRDDHDTQYRTLERLGAALEDYAATRPLVIAIDDAQWMDELSALAIAELVRALASSPVRWLFARRPAPTGTPGQQLIDRLIREGIEQFSLGTLDDTAVGRLCAQVVGAEVDNTVLALVSGCDGNPLQVEQLVRTLHLTGQLVVAGGVGTVVGDELPSSFITIVDQMLRGLSSDTQQLLQAGSVFGRPFSVDAVAQLLDVRPATLLKQIKEATAARVLVDEGEGLTFVHDLVRLAVYGTLGDTVGRMLHRQAALVTRAEHRSPVEVAGHLLKTGRSGTQEAVTMLHEAALEVADAAPSTAADLIVHALDVLGEHDPGRVTLIADAVGLLASASRLEEARDLGEAALRAGLDARTEAMLLLGLAEAFKHIGRNRTAVEFADRGLRHTDVPDSVRAKLWAVRAHALFYCGDMAGADDSGANAYSTGLGAQEFGASVFGLTARSLVAEAEGRLDDAFGHAEEATEIADRVKGEAAHRHPRIWLGSTQAALDRFDEAEITFRRGRQESERLGTAWSTPLWHYYNTALLTGRGLLDDAVTEAEAGVAVALNVTAYALALPLLGSLTRLAVMQADNAQAQAHLAHMHRLMAIGITAAPEDITWAEGLVQEAVAGPEAAMHMLTGMYDALPERPVLIGQDPSAAATLVRIAIQAEDRRRAELVATTARRLAARNGTVHSLAAAADHAEGVLRGDPRLLRAAIERFRLTPRRLALAGALEDAALVTDDAGQARLWGTEAIEIVTECGAKRAQLRLSAGLGARHAPALGAAAMFRDTSPLAQLTPAERNVAILVAGGLKNRQVAIELFLSRHTVDSHLRKIFVKLGIRSRVELANLVARDRLIT